MNKTKKSPQANSPQGRKSSSPEVLSERSFSKAQRCQIIEEYLSGTATRGQVWKKYTGRDQEHGCLLRWMRQLGYLSKTGKERRRKRTILPKGNPQSGYTLLESQCSNQMASSQVVDNQSISSPIVESFTPLRHGPMSDLDPEKNPLDAENTNAENTNAENTNAENTNAENTNAGNTNAGNTNAGNTNAGNTNAGNTNAEKEALLSQIQHLKAALQQAQLKAEGYELMIQLAEKQFQIPIRKKSATK